MVVTQGRGQIPGAGLFSCPEEGAKDFSSGTRARVTSHLHLSPPRPQTRDCISLSCEMGTHLLRGGSGIVKSACSQA